MIKVGLELQPCVKQRSGIGVYTYEIAKRLHSNNLISYSGNILDFLDIHSCRNSLSEISYPLSLNKSISYSVYRRVWNYIPVSYNNLFEKKNDIFHFFNYIVPPKISGSVITTIHDMAYIDHPETLDPKNLKRISESIESSVKRSNIIITISEFSKQRILEEFKIPEKNIKIISPSFQTTKFDMNFDILSDKFQINVPYILYVGNIEPRKNISRLIKSFHLLKNINRQINHKLVIVGGKGWLYEEIFNLISDLKMKDDIIFTGFVTNEEKTSFYKNASLFIFPSLYEGFGIPILEAMSVGTPVVCSSTSSMPEVGGEAAFYINPLDVNDIANGINTVLSNPLLKNSMIQKGYEQIKKFSWDESAKKLEQIYLSI